MNDIELDPTGERLYTTKELSEMFQKTEWTIRMWVTKGYLKCNKIDGRLFFTASQIRDYANGRWGE